MYQGKHFMRVFEKVNSLKEENIDPLTHQLSPMRFSLNPNVVDMLSKIGDSISMITAIGFTAKFFTTVRNMMLLDIVEDEIDSQTNNFAFNQLYLSNKIEIVPSQPVEWIYGEIKLRKEDHDGSLSPIRVNSIDFLEIKIGASIIASLLGSTAIIIQATEGQFLDQIVKYLKEGHQRMHDLPGVFPKIYVICNLKNQNQSQLQQLSILRNRDISTQLIVSEFKEGWQEQSRLISIGKSIISGQKPKIIQKVIITSKLLVFLWKALANQGDMIVPISVWSEAQDYFMQEQSQHAFQQYVSRIDDITEGQQFFSSSFFRDAQPKVRSDVLRQVTERAGFMPQSESIMKTERRLLEWKEELQTRNFKAVQDWGREFVRQAWNIIEKKLGKQIKNIFGLRQQTQILFEFFKKKSQQFTSAELVVKFVEFLLPKLFEATQTITNSIVSPLQEQQMTMQAQIVNMAAEAKELRRRVGKEQNQLARRAQELKEKNMQLEASCEVSEKCLQLTKKELNEVREACQQKISKMLQDYQQILRKKEKLVEQKDQQLDNCTKKIALLESELNKERLLHEQTRHFYEQNVALLKSKEEEARAELEHLSLSASRQLCLLRENSTKQMDEYSNSTEDLLKKVTIQQQLLIERDEALEKMMVDMQTLRQQLMQSEALSTKVHELQLRNKILEDMDSECESLRGRNRRLQEQLKRLSKEKDQQAALNQQNEAKFLILKERFEHYSVQMQFYKSKCEEMVLQLVQQRQEKQQLLKKLSVYSSKKTNDACFQAEDSSVKEKLIIALETINELQAQYSKVKSQFEWRSRS